MLEASRAAEEVATHKGASAFSSAVLNATDSCSAEAMVQKRMSAECKQRVANPTGGLKLRLAIAHVRCMHSSPPSPRLTVLRHNPGSFIWGAAIRCPAWLLLPSHAKS